MVFEPGAHGVEIVVDPAQIGIVGEQWTDHRCPHPELIGVQMQFLEDGGEYVHGSNASGKKIQPTVAVLTR